MTMKKYTKREPDIVRAIQFTGENADEILIEFFGSCETFSLNVTWETGRNGRRVKGLTLNSDYVVDCELLEGDYLVKTMSGELIGYSEDRFLELYKEIE